MLDQRFGPKKTRFITLAFLLHLLFPRHVPIIDQHNFRAVNGLMSDIRADWPPPRKTQKPSQYSDIECIADFSNTFFRYKSIIGDSLRARSPAGQGSEVVLGCEILNRMIALGRPVSYRIGR